MSKNKNEGDRFSFSIFRKKTSGYKSKYQIFHALERYQNTLHLYLGIRDRKFGSTARLAEYKTQAPLF